MQFTKPQEVAPRTVEIVIIGNAVLVSRSNSHPLSDEIRAALRSDGWEIEFDHLGFWVKGFTAPDRKVLRRELAQAYQVA